jgi:hypothetical protein
MSFTNQKLSSESSIKSKNDLVYKWRLIGREIKEEELNLTLI